MATGVGALLFAAGASVAAVNTAIAVTGAIISAAITVGVNVAVNFAADAIFGKQNKSPAPKDIQGVLRQSIGERKKSTGTVRVGGNIIFTETLDGWLYQIVVVNQDQISGFVKYYIDNRVVTINGSGGVLTSPYSINEQTIQTRIGATNSAAYSSLVSKFPTIWSNAHQLKGLATLLLTTASVDESRFSEVYPQRIAEPNVIINGVAVFDPRTQTSIFSANLALGLRDFFTSANGMGLSSSMIDDASFIVAANICDQNVALKAGGTTKRYHGGVTYKLNEEPKDIIARYLTPMAGRTFLTSDGKIGIVAGAWVEPTITIDDSVVLSYSLTNGNGPLIDANEVIIGYTQIESEYSEVTCEPWRDEAAISAEGETRSIYINSYEIQSHNHARRIAKITQMEAAPNWKGTIVVDLFGMECWAKMFINVQLNDLGIDESFKVMGVAFDFLNMNAILSVQTASAAIYAFNAATEEGTAPQIPVILASSGLEVPTNVVASTSSQVLGTVSFDDRDTTNEVTQEPDFNISNNVISDIDTQTQNYSSYSLSISWTSPTRTDLTARVEYKKSTESNWQSVNVSRGQSSVSTGSVGHSGTYNSRVRFVGPSGRQSAWVNANNVAVPAN